MSPVSRTWECNTLGTFSKTPLCLLSCCRLPDDRIGEPRMIFVKWFLWCLAALRGACLGPMESKLILSNLICPVSHAERVLLRNYNHSPVLWNWGHDVVIKERAVWNLEKVLTEGNTIVWQLLSVLQMVTYNSFATQSWPVRFAWWKSFFVEMGRLRGKDGIPNWKFHTY